MNMIFFRVNARPCTVQTTLYKLKYQVNETKLVCALFETFELCTRYCTNRVISDKVHRLFVTLSYFRPDRFLQLLSLIPILILLLYLLVSIGLVYTGVYKLVLGVYPEGEQQ